MNQKDSSQNRMHSCGILAIITLYTPCRQPEVFDVMFDLHDFVIVASDLDAISSLF